MRVAVRIFHPPAPAPQALLAGWLHDARTNLAAHHDRAFVAAGADDVAVVTQTDPPDAPVPFGRRLKALLPALEASGATGLVLLGSGALPFAAPADHRRLVAAAGGAPGTALANNRYSADVVAVAGLDRLRDTPDDLTDNTLPRWLDEHAGCRVSDLREKPALLVDLDTPLDLVLVAGASGPTLGWVPPVPAAVDLRLLGDRLARLRAVVHDPAAELVLAGRTSARAIAWLERGTRARARVLVEERGLKTGSTGGRPPASVLAMLLDRDGPEALGAILARLGEAAIVDTRVLLAHRLGRDESRWPAAEDRFASDLLLPAAVRDPWLRALTASAATAPVPVLLGGHTLVGPGLPLALAGA